MLKSQAALINNLIKFHFRTDLANVSVVQSSVDLIQDKEGGWFVAIDKQERSC